MNDTGNQPGAIQTVRARRISTADTPSPSVAEDVRVVREVPLTIDVDGLDRFTVLCTPADRRAMALGFLFTEGVIDGMADVETVRLCEDDPAVIRVKLAAGVTRTGDPARNLIITTACGACGAEDLDRRLETLPVVGRTLRIENQVLRRVSRRFQEGQSLFEACGGTHAVALFNEEGEIFAGAEDMGRHNALDKAIGKCLLSGVPTVGCAAKLSGRVSLEMVSKCARAGIELISAISAPTSLAVEVAERCGITLCAFVRDARATVFTHPGRVIGAME